MLVDVAADEELVVDEAALLFEDDVELVDMKTRRKKLNVAGGPVQVLAIELAIWTNKTIISVPRCSTATQILTWART